MHLVDMAVEAVLPEHQDITVAYHRRTLSKEIPESAEGQDLTEGSEGNKEVSVLLKSDEIEHDGELPNSGFLNIVLHTTHDTGRRIRLSIRNHPRPLPPSWEWWLLFGAPFPCYCESSVRGAGNNALDDGFSPRGFAVSVIYVLVEVASGYLDHSHFDDAGFGEVVG